ncbi:MAG TPA: RNA 2',3'-cyclic phosphodiesterase [Dehalococcoidia bacterium]|nr:RNA 2',3'-cyclic phosphodiesterase [Dehalococcoidia bacterium]
MATRPDSSGSKKLRLFIALELPEAMKEELAAAQERLRARLKVRLKWVRPESIHLTLKFLGYVDEDRAQTIGANLSQAVSSHGELSLHLGGLGSFGGRRPRVVWVGVGGDVEELAALQRSIDREMATLGFEPEVRGYNAHLTLARVPDGLNRLQLDEVLHAVGNVAPPGPAEATFDEVSLMRSTLRREGAVYDRLFVAPLGTAKGASA